MNYEPNWVLRVDKAVWKYLRRVPKKDAERVVLVMQTLVLNPYSGDVQKMEGEENTWRRRVGAYRIKYEILLEKRIAHVFEVSRRTSSTY